VAIKVLPDTFAHDPERLARFERAKTLAALNHPNIAGIHGLERAEGTRALVMELVEGPTLAETISQGPVPLDEALHIAKQIAEALDAAHQQGIVHRDLKPANIKVREDGTVKVLDFGLAKVLEPAGAIAPGVTQSPTITSPAMATIAGMLLGTAAYMSPEQARGKPADKRADIWAFGCVLYEMSAGEPLFKGEDVTEILASVVATSNGIYASGHLLFLRESTLLAQPFDPVRSMTTGDALPIADNVSRLAGETQGVFTAAENGTLVYGLSIRGAFPAGLPFSSMHSPTEERDSRWRSLE
jgi:serine/threonine protein kinase